MSWYLAVDTATDVGSVAVGRPGALGAEVVFGSRRHAGALVPAVAEALRLAGVPLQDITGFAIADGPGSFTGLRIGFATVQGLVKDRSDRDVVTAPSLMATAWHGARYVDGPVASLYDALRGEVFAAVYRFQRGAVEVILAPCLTTLSRLKDLGLHPRIAVGDGAATYAEAVRAWTGRDPVAPPAGAPRAASLIELLAVAGAVRKVDDVQDWEPDYGRPAEAQARWERKHGRPLPGTTGGND